MLDPCGDDNDDDEEEEEEEDPCIKPLSTTGCTASLQVWVSRDIFTTCKILVMMITMVRIRRRRKRTL